MGEGGIEGQKRGTGDNNGRIMVKDGMIVSEMEEESRVEEWKEKEVGKER